MCTQSFCSSSPMHRSKALGVKTRMKFLANFTLLRRFSSNFPAFSFSISRKTENPRNWRWTFSKLQKTTYIKHTYCNKYLLWHYNAITFVQLMNQRPLHYIQMTSNLLSLSLMSNCWSTTKKSIMVKIKILLHIYFLIYWISNKNEFLKHPLFNVTLWINKWLVHLNTIF